MRLSGHISTDYKQTLEDSCVSFYSFSQLDDWQCTSLARLISPTSTFTPFEPRNTFTQITTGFPIIFSHTWGSRVWLGSRIWSVWEEREDYFRTCIQKSTSQLWYSGQMWGTLGFQNLPKHTSEQKHIPLSVSGGTGQVTDSFCELCHESMLQYEWQRMK